MPIHILNIHNSFSFGPSNVSKKRSNKTFCRKFIRQTYLFIFNLLYITQMKNGLLILLLCISAIYAKPAHDTVYVEQIIRDTVYIPIKSKTDTIYIKKTSANENYSKAAPQPKCCTPTERNPLGQDTTKFLRYDTSYTHHLFYLHFDLISIPWMIDTNFTSIGGNIEVSANRKNSFMINFRYSKMKPGATSAVFVSSIYQGDITQYDIGMGYRHYLRPSKYSFYYDVGGNWLIRKYDYINTWDFKPTLYNERPHSRHDTGYLFAPYFHMGHMFRGNQATFDFEYGIAYSAKDGDLLKKEFSYITGGIQFDFRINIGVGIL